MLKICGVSYRSTGVSRNVGIADKFHYTQTHEDWASYTVDLDYLTKADTERDHGVMISWAKTSTQAAKDCASSISIPGCVRRPFDISSVAAFGNLCASHLHSKLEYGGRGISETMNNGDFGTCVTASQKTCWKFRRITCEGRLRLVKLHLVRYRRLHGVLTSICKVPPYDVGQNYKLCCL